MLSHIFIDPENFDDNCLKTYFRCNCFLCFVPFLLFFCCLDGIINMRDNNWFILLNLLSQQVLRTKYWGDNYVLRVKYKRKKQFRSILLATSRFLKQKEVRVFMKNRLYRTTRPKKQRKLLLECFLFIASIERLIAVN